MFVCSADTEFSQIGNQTSIDYRVLHLSVKRLLHLTADSEFTKGVMAHFNKHVFGHTITATEHIDISQADELPENMEEPDLIARLKSFSVSNPEPEPESDVSTGMSWLCSKLVNMILTKGTVVMTKMTKTCFKTPSLLYQVSILMIIQFNFSSPVCIGLTSIHI